MKRSTINKSRLENFSDGVIAIIITVLVLAFHIPEGVDINTLSFTELLKSFIPQLVPYGISFIVVAVHLVNHHILFKQIKDTDHTFTWLNMFFLFSLSLIVFPTELVGKGHNLEMATKFLVSMYFFKAVTFQLLSDYAVLRSGLYIGNKTRKERRRTSIINWLRGPILEVIAFCLIYVDYRLALGLIFVNTLIYLVSYRRL